jgi:hypothetical protein
VTASQSDVASPTSALGFTIKLPLFVAIAEDAHNREQSAIAPINVRLFIPKNLLVDVVR